MYFILFIQLYHNRLLLIIHTILVIERYSNTHIVYIEAIKLNFFNRQ